VWRVEKYQFQVCHTGGSISHTGGPISSPSPRPVYLQPPTMDTITNQVTSDIEAGSLSIHDQLVLIIAKNVSSAIDRSFHGDRSEEILLGLGFNPATSSVDLTADHLTTYNTSEGLKHPRNKLSKKDMRWLVAWSNIDHGSIRCKEQLFAAIEAAVSATSPNAQNSERRPSAVQKYLASDGFNNRDNAWHRSKSDMWKIGCCGGMPLLLALVCFVMAVRSGKGSAWLFWIGGGLFAIMGVSLGGLIYSDPDNNWDCASQYNAS